MPLKVVLIHPEIPPNTGNIARLCVGCDVELHLVKPLGFSIEDRYLKRAGLDYWDRLRLRIYENLDEFLSLMPSPIYFFSTRSERRYLDIKFSCDDWLVFGAETKGLPPDIMERFASNLYSIPMPGDIRCLNLSNAVAIVVYEALRQTRII